MPLYGAIIASQRFSRRVEARREVGQPLLEVRAVVRPQLATACRRSPCAMRFAVLRIQPVVRIALRVHVAHRARDLARRDLENRAPERRVEIAVGAGLNLRVAALLDQRRQPADLQLAADDDQQVGLLQLQDEARLGLDEVRILIAASRSTRR